MRFASRSVIFDEFRLIDPDSPRITCCGILYLLLQRHGEVVFKNEIVDAVWPHMAVEENNLTVQISALRRALDEGRNRESCIQTVRGRVCVPKT
jgi:DNA-binding response OmpR family regulator